MNIEKLRELIIQKSPDLLHEKIEIDGINSIDEVDQLIKSLSSKDLIISNLSIKVDNEVSDYFISKFMNMEPKPKIIGLKLPKIKLLVENWQTFFKKLPGFEGLNDLDLENSNYNYNSNIDYLGEYIAGNPILKEINLCGDDKADDKTFLSGFYAQKLFNRLKKNANLTCIKYGHGHPELLSQNLSEEIKQKLAENAYNRHLKEKLIPESVSNQSNDTYLKEKRKKLEQLIIGSIDDSLLKGTEDEKKIRLLGKSGTPPSITNLFIELSLLKVELKEAMQDKEFSEKLDQVDNIEKLILYYDSLYELINALNIMYQLELEASPHDRPILHNLRNNLLTNCKSLATTVYEENELKDMVKLIELMYDNCDKAIENVKDKTSGALIKNVLLILSAIFTFGISLGIYAAVTKQSRALRGSFFFKDEELNKNKIEEVKEMVDYVLMSFPEKKF